MAQQRGRLRFLCKVPALYRGTGEKTGERCSFCIRFYLERQENTLGNDAWGKGADFV